MFNISKIYRNTSFTFSLAVQVRFKNKVHWAKLRKKTSPKYKALDNFDDFYGSVFGDQWPAMREAMFRSSKYMAVVNNYGDADETIEALTNRGAHCLKKLMNIQREHNNQYLPQKPDAEPNTQDQLEHKMNKLNEFLERQHTDQISSIYPNADNVPERLDFEISEPEIKKLKKVYEEDDIPNTTLDKSIAEAEIDSSRIIDPSMGITSEALYQFLPATKLKGMDDWLSESVNYSFNSKEKDFPLLIEAETELNYPEHLKVYTYEMDSDLKTFPEPKRCQTGVYNYYPMDGGSILPVLALGLRPGDRVLDLCSAPGGKALVMLQTLLPDVVICNDISISRSNRTKATFRNYFFDFETSNKWRERLVFNRIDGRYYVDDQGFDKVLVDVPCTTDRHTLNTEENNIFRPDRIKERLRLPEMQSQLLVNALKLVRMGGTVVYSTCSLSPMQNDGVVHLSLKRAFETHSIVATVKDLTAPMAALRSTLVLGSGPTAPQYGQLVTPSVGANFGPSYVAKLVRVR